MDPKDDREIRRTETHGSANVGMVAKYVAYVIITLIIVFFLYKLASAFLTGM